jgi:hypothetical protein
MIGKGNVLLLAGLASLASHPATAIAQAVRSCEPVAPATTIHLDTPSASLVPVTIDGQPATRTLNLEAGLNFVLKTAVERLHLRTHALPRGADCGITASR